MVEEDFAFMVEAIGEARRAGDMGEVPIGAVVVMDGEIIARGHNRRESAHDPTAHAETVALREAGSALGHTDLSFPSTWDLAPALIREFLAG